MNSIRATYKELYLIYTSLKTGIKLTLLHFFQAKKQRKPIGIEQSNYFEQGTGLFTTLYPYEALPIPDNGRNRLNNEIDDCIVCDLCAKICPVDCIEIEPIKSTEEIGKTSDGSSKKIYAATFDIDMAKCCYCGLCTTVCPTECLTMTNAYDYSEYDVKNMIYSFSDLSPEQAEEKRKVYEEAQLLKAKAKAEKQAQSEQASTHEAKLPSAPKPFKPVIKAPSITKTVKPELENENKIDSPNNEDSEANPDQTEILNKEIKNTGAEDGVIKATNTKTESTLPSKPKPVFKPVIKPIIKKDIPPQSEDKND